LAPRDPQVLAYVADVDVHIHRPDLAVETYKCLLAVDPHNAPILAHLADLYLEFDWPLEAQALLEPAVRALPDNLDLKIALAAVYAQYSNFAAAEPLLSAIRRHSPAESTLWSNMAHVYLLSHRYSDAITVAQQAVDQWHDPVGWLYLGQAYYAQGDYDHAIQAYRQMLAQQPQAPDPHYYLGLCYQQQNRPEEALQEWETVLRSHPDFQQTRLLLGQLYIRMGRAAEGERLLAEFRREKPEQAKLTAAYYVVSVSPHSAEAHWQMAQVYRDEGNMPLLLVELKKTLELDPHHAAARRLLDQTLPHTTSVVEP
ncbi:MAG TPA: tetratricopeptide repeat protein, partial [Chthonomonadaceae bacterium]|nr:tetratricopeptide repeat protein [Chthonomonadaceae bacterium]